MHGSPAMSKPDPRALVAEADTLTDRAEKLRQRALSVALPASGWRLKAAAKALGMPHGTARRVLERMPDLTAEYERRKVGHRPPGAK